MKRNILYILLFSAALQSACNKDFLDRKPLDAYSNSSLWTSQADAAAALSGCYKGWEGDYAIIYMDAASDNMYSQYPWEGYTAYGNSTVTPGNTDV